MKKLVLLFSILTLSVSVSLAQSYVSVTDIQFVSAADLANCDDVSAYDGQTVKTVGVVMHDGNLTEVSSGSVNGGYRPGVFILDTAAGGDMGSFAGIEIHGVYQDGSGQNQPVSTIDNLVAGMIIEVTGTVGAYQGQTQLNPSDNSSVKVIGTTSVPKSDTIDLGLLNDKTRTNILTTGEEWEGSFVTLKDLTVIGVSIFSGNRVSFDVSDADGNQINISDRFVAQKLASRTLVNPSSPFTAGEFVAPIVGTKFESISGIIMHSENGCTGSGGRGYELNPFDSTHYKIGDTPPSITEVTRTPLVPSSMDNVTLSAKILDFNGTVDKQTLYYSTDLNQDVTAFTSVAMTLKGGTTDEFEASIPAQADGQIVRYYITAEDNDGNLSYEPFSVNSASKATAFYTVRDGGLTIADLQKVLNVTADRSPYDGQTVTVKGVVTASAKPYDLEEIYIQDKDAKEWAGIRISGNSDLLDLWRTEEVEITGTVAESYGFTTLNVSSVTKTGNTYEIEPVELAVSDSAAIASREIEKYEGMLVKMVNSAGKVVINNPRLNPFGEWTVSNDADASFANSTKVQTGVKNGNNNSSLWVSVVSNDTLADDGGIMEVAAIEAEKGMTMDAMVGILYYGFGQYAVKPRNNDDLVNFSEDLDTTNYADTASSGSVITLNELGVSIYPNPANSVLNFKTSATVKGSLAVLDLQGRELKQVVADQINTTINVADLNQGTYVLRFVTTDGVIATSRFVKL